MRQIRSAASAYVGESAASIAQMSTARLIADFSFYGSSGTLWRPHYLMIASRSQGNQSFCRNLRHLVADFKGRYDGLPLGS
jgi:hypothetical protein